MWLLLAFLFALIVLSILDVDDFGILKKEGIMDKVENSTRLLFMRIIHQAVLDYANAGELFKHSSGRLEQKVPIQDQESAINFLFKDGTLDAICNTFSLYPASLCRKNAIKMRIKIKKIGEIPNNVLTE